MYVYIQTRAEWIVSRSLYILASANQCKHHLFFTFIFVLSYVCQDDKVFLYHDGFFYPWQKQDSKNRKTGVVYIS